MQRIHGLRVRAGLPTGHVRLCFAPLIWMAAPSRTGERFHFDLNLFDLDSPAVAYLVLAFAQLTRQGLGPRRSRVELVSVTQSDENGHPAATLFKGTSLILSEGAQPVANQPRSRRCEPVSRLRVHFLTPTELKSGQQIAARPEFSILAARVRDRISTLRELYDEGPLEIDFRALANAPRRCG